MGDLTTNFSRSEFECKCGCGLCIADHSLVEVLQHLRSYYDRVLHLNSATRCETHNADVDGWPTSQHMLGLAADIRIEGVEPRVVHDYLVSYAGDYGKGWGIGRYDDFTHIDVRRVAARWEG